MRENQLPVHYTSAEETGRIRPALDSGDGGVHVTHVEARSAGNYLADGLSNSVHITLAHFSAAGSASAASAVAVAPRALPGPRNQSVAYDPVRHTKLEGARDSKLGTWLLASAVISVTTLYTICNPKWVPSFVAQTVKVSKQLSADAVTDTAKAEAGTVAGAAGIHVAPTGRNSASAVQPKGETGNHTARSNAGDSGSAGGMLPPLSPQSKPMTDNTEMPKAAETKTSKSKKGFMIPPPPPTPCVLPPAFDFFPMQPAQQDAAPQQPTVASGRTEASQSAALDVADQELQAALSSSISTVGEWTR